jgi:hypothetical protein
VLHKRGATWQARNSPLQRGRFGGRGAICCLQISFSNQVRSGYSHGRRSSWELLKIALAGGAYLEVSWAHSHMEALELMPVGVSPWATTGAGPCISSQVVPSTQ